MRAVGPTSAIRLSLFLRMEKFHRLIPSPSSPPSRIKPLHSTPEEFIAFHFQFSSLTIRLSFFFPPPLSREMKLTPVPVPRHGASDLFIPNASQFLDRYYFHFALLRRLNRFSGY